MKKQMLNNPWSQTMWDVYKNYLNDAFDRKQKSKNASISFRSPI